MLYFFFLSGDAIEKKIGQSGLNALTCIRGLILVTSVVQVFLGGLYEYIPTISSLMDSAGNGS